MDDLVQRLSTGRHPVELRLRPERTAQEFKKALDRGYVNVHFTGTRGGTELGVRLERESVRLEGADFDAGTGQVRFVGSLTLNYVPVRCVVDMDLATFSGQGHLELVGTLGG
jgi:hypothetical protein